MGVSLKAEKLYHNLNTNVLLSALRNVGEARYIFIVILNNFLQQKKMCDFIQRKCNRKMHLTIHRSTLIFCVFILFVKTFCKFAGFFLIRRCASFIGTARSL